MHDFVKNNTKHLIYKFGWCLANRTRSFYPILIQGDTGINMGIYSILCLTSILAIGASARTCCDNKNLLQDLSFKLTGSDVAFPCESTRNIYKTTGRYVPKNMIPTRIQIYKDDAIVAIPRYRHGVPFTVARFPLKTKGCKATLSPFPCWEIQEEGNCEAIQNAIDIVIDPLDHLWVLDLGIVNTLEQPVRRCAPKIVGIKLETGLIVKTLDLEPFVTVESRLQYLVVDYAKDGRPFAYVSDGGTGSIIVFDIQLGTGYRVVLPPAVHGGCACKDVLYIELARKPSGNVLYFTYLCSPRLFSIKTEYLQKGQASGAVVDVGPKPPGTKIVLLGTDNGAAIFFRYKGESDIYIWNTETCFKSENFVLVQKGGDCRLATQVVPGWKRLMWALESNFHDYINNTTGCLGASIAVHPLIKTSD